MKHRYSETRARASAKERFARFFFKSKSRMKRNAYFTFLLLTFLLVGRTNGLAQVRTTPTAPAPPDTVKGAAMIFLEYMVTSTDGDQSWYSVQAVPVWRVRRSADDIVTLNEQTGQLKAYITHYFLRDWTPLSKEEVVLFIKKEWK